MLPSEQFLKQSIHSVPNGFGEDTDAVTPEDARTFSVMFAVEQLEEMYPKDDEKYTNPFLYRDVKNKISSLKSKLQ